MDKVVIPITNDNQYLHRDDLILRYITLKKREKEVHINEVKENKNCDIDMETKKKLNSGDKSKHSENVVISKDTSDEIKTCAIGDHIHKINGINNHEVLVETAKENLNKQSNDLNNMDQDKTKLPSEKATLVKENSTSLSMESSKDSKISHVPEHSKAEKLESQTNQEQTNTIDKTKVNALKVDESDDNDELEYSHLDDILDKQLNSINNNIEVSKSDVNNQKISGETIENAEKSDLNDENITNKNGTQIGKHKNMASDNKKNTVDDDNEDSTVNDGDKQSTVDVDDDEKLTVNKVRDTDNNCQNDGVKDNTQNATTFSIVDDKESIIADGSDDEVICEKQDNGSSSDYDSDVDYMEIALQFIERVPVVKVQRSEFFSCQFCYQSFQSGHAYELHCLTHIKPRKTQPPEQPKKAKFKPDDPYNPIHDCPDCDASFVQISTLREHAALHAPKPNICRCGIGYYKNQDLLGHIKVVHNNNIEEWVEVSENTSPKTPKTKEKSKVPKEKPKKIVTIYKDDDDIEKEDSDKDSVVSNWASRRKRKKAKKKHEKSKNDDNLVDMLCPEVGINESERVLCTVCNQTFLNKRTYEAHAKRHKPKTHPCEKCGKKFATEKELEKHVYDHATNVCPVCNKEIASKMGLKIHMRIHTGERPYACTYKNCPKRFNQGGALKNHLLVHAGERNFKCSFCDKAFVQLASLYGHERIHMNLKQYVCRYCHKGFNDPSAFGRHERTHTGDKRYKCPQCPMAFTDASGLIVHKRRHTGKRDFKCTQCDKSFFTKSDLKKHEFLHTKQTAVECHICGIQFALKQYLKTHIQVMHTEIKKEACKLCMKKLKPFYMDRHMADVHGINTKNKRLRYFAVDK